MGLFATRNTKQKSEGIGEIHGFPGGWTVRYNREEFESSFMSADDAAEGCARLLLDQPHTQSADGKSIDIETLAYQSKQNRIKGPHGKYFHLAKRSDGYWLTTKQPGGWF